MFQVTHHFYAASCGKNERSLLFQFHRSAAAGSHVCRHPPAGTRRPPLLASLPPQKAALARSLASYCSGGGKNLTPTSSSEDAVKILAFPSASSVRSARSSSHESMP
jgi:hypothetical protein